ncbi:MAG: hypothetical protein ACR2OO_12720 [Thermomicrobiales bacterium]
MTDQYSLKVATFVVEALELEADPAKIADTVGALKRDVNAGISTLELQSASGPAAFLIYHYVLETVNAKGRSGRQLFETDLATLERATAQNTPGPRVLAHIVDRGEAYVLATTPDVFRSLTGIGEDDIEASEADLPPGPATVAARNEAADALLRLLREADASAAAWLRAIRSEGRLRAEDGGERIDFSDEESALALFLLDNRSIHNLLQVLNVMIASAREQAAEALDRPTPPFQA